MDIKINIDTATAMARRLRKKIGLDVIAESKSFEALAQALGFKNWDTLSGKLKAEKPSASVLVSLSVPKELFVLAFACDENGDSADWARIDLNNGFLERVLRLREMCKTQKLEHVCVDDQPAYWHDPSEVSIRGESLYVSEGSFWFRGTPKHCDYAVETRSVDIEGLLKLLQGGESDENMQLHLDAVVISSYGDASGLIQCIEDVDMFDKAS